VTKWEKEGYQDAMEKALYLLADALAALRMLKPTDIVERASLDALRRDIADFTDDPDAEEPEDDGTCGPCGGSGGGDYPGIYCPHCNGRGYRKVRGEP
jgi:hypothetical protein